MTDPQVALLAATISLPNWKQGEVLERADRFLTWLTAHDAPGDEFEHRDNDGTLTDIIPQPIYHGFRPEEPA